MFNQGDRVVVRIDYEEPHLATIDRVTDHQVIIAGRRFRRQSGRLIGGDIWRSGSIHYPTEQDIAQIARSAMIRQCRAIKWAALSDEQLASVLSIVTAQTPDCTGTPDE